MYAGPPIVYVKGVFVEKFLTTVPVEMPTMTVELEIFAPTVRVGTRGDAKLEFEDSTILTGEEYFYSIGNQLVKCPFGSYRQVGVQYNKTADFIVWDSKIKILSIARDVTTKDNVGEYPIRVTQTCTNSTYVDTLVGTFTLVIEPAPATDYTWDGPEPLQIHIY